MKTHDDNAEITRGRRPWRLPVLQGILPLDKTRIAPDIVAGVTLAALGIPEVMGYTKIIGTPVITGLYTMLLPLVVFAVFGSSRHLVVGADSATAAIVAAALVSLAIPSGQNYLAMTGLIALLSGGMLLLARVFRLAFLADFLSRTVLVGFLSGVGVQVACHQLPGLLGLEAGGHGFFGQLLFTFRHVPQTHAMSLYISLGVLAVIAGFERLAPRFPGALVAVVGAIVASAVLHWGEQGVSVVGEVPQGLPALRLPEVSWSQVMPMLSVSFSCAIVILAQSAATSSAYALRYRDPFSENVDLVGLALANAAAGCSGTFVVNGSPTKTAMVDSAGGRSQISHLTAAAVALIVSLFLTKPLSYLPHAVLAAIVFLIGVRLVDYRGLREILRKKPREFALAMTTGVAVLVVGVERGIILAMVLSLLQHVRRGYRPHSAIIVHDPVEHWQMNPITPVRMIEPGMVLYWFGAELYYANIGHFVEEAQRLVNESPAQARWLVVDAGAITAIDFSAGRALVDLQADLARKGVALAFARVNDQLQADLDSQGVTRGIGPDRIFKSRKHCLAAYRATISAGQNHSPEDADAVMSAAEEKVV
ncbi:MAG: sodium-independent anion transporter [Verrucomicrobia bacterium]|nr:MAG: sodium-independent anion transporter [Verrucomicrobiota bacterium]